LAGVENNPGQPVERQLTGGSCEIIWLAS